MLLRCWMLFLAALALVQPAKAEVVQSPDGRIAVTVTVDGEGRPLYAVDVAGQPVITPSQLGFLFTDSDPLRRGLRLVRTARSDNDSQWEQPWGERRIVRDRHRELLVELAESDESPLRRRLFVRFRVFDDGVGFRYEFPVSDGFATANIAEELTEFALAGDGSAWWIPGGDWNRYEYLYSHTPIAEVSTAHTPITMKLAHGPYLAFHEAALVDYSAMWLRRMDGLRFRAQLSPSSRGAKVVRDLPFHTPWRTIRIADTAAGLYANDIDLNLNEPSKIADISWFKPHKYIGIWWEMHLDKSSWASGPKHGATTANAIRHLDFAAKHGFRGVLIEGWNKGWDGNWFGNGRDFSFTEAYPDFDIKAVTDHARKKGVRLIGHHETGGNIKVYEDQLEAAMALYERLGVDAVKTGYVADAGGIIAPGPNGKGEIFEWHDGQRQVQHHLKVVEVAARHHIAVNPHEPVKDTGLRRTWPNWVSREGARGAEYDAWGSPKNLPTHVPTLVFTRMLAGPMDYTPGVFSLTGRDGGPIPSTLARQLAYYVVIYSPIQMVADLPENLEKWPQALAFVRDVPADWEDSRMIAGAIGEYAVIARQDRASKDWWVGGVTDDTARGVDIDTAFLAPGGRYVVTIWRDGASADGLGANQHDMLVERRTIRGGDALTLTMARAGGFAMRIQPQ